MHQDIEAAEAVEDARPDHVEPGAIQQVEREQGRTAALRPDRIVDLGQAALGAGGEDDMHAGAGEFARDGGTDAAAGTGDQGDLLVHQLSVSRLSCLSALSFMSVSAIG